MLETDGVGGRVTPLGWLDCAGDVSGREGNDGEGHAGREWRGG